MTATEPVDLTVADLHPALGDPALTSMNFLNEVSERYPAAVSLAAGRPYEEFFDLAAVHRHLDTFHRHLADDLGHSSEQARRLLLQYGRTKGIVHHLIARNLAVDEGITVDPEAVVVTVGCQEAMFLVLRALRAGPADVLLAVAPTYVGLTGAARLVDLPVWPVAGGPSGVDLADLSRPGAPGPGGGAAAACLLRDAGLRQPVRGQHRRPDDRRRLLDAGRRGGPAAAGGQPVRAVPLRRRAAPAHPQGVGHRRGGSSTSARSPRPCCPGRGSATSSPTSGWPAPDGRVGPLADQLAMIKSMVTVNTSPIAQAVIGGRLLEHGCSLVAANARERSAYTRNLRHLVAGLARRFPAGRTARRGALDGAGRRVLRGGDRAVPGRRRAAGPLGPRLRGAVDADGALLRRHARRCARCGCRSARSHRNRSTSGWTAWPR